MADYAIHDTTLTGISDVIRKKEGSSALIDPADYADRINLMGMLEEKNIVPWSISSFSDGADDVPTKSIVVTIPPTLLGVSSVTETQTGRNFIPLLTWYTAGYEYTTNGVTFKILADGGIKITGKSTASAYSQFTLTAYSISPQTEQQLQVPTGTYTFSLNGIVDGIRLVTSGSGNNGFPYSEVTYTSQARSGAVTDGTKPFNYLFLRVYPTDNNLDVTVYPQLELGSTAHAYEQYQTPTVYTASLGRTIYGGQVDIVNGTGTDNCTRIKFSDLNWTYYTGGTNPIFYANNVPDMKTYARAEMPNIAIDGYTTRTAHSRSNLSTNMANMECSAIENAQTITFRNDTYTSVSDMLEDMGNEYIVYEVATPTDFTFDGQEINTRLGYNAFWSEQGDTEVTYRSSGTVTPIVPTLITKNITDNGTYNASSDNADGYSSVTVAVQPNVGTKRITDNGTYAASGDSLDGYSSVTVEVPTAPSGMVVMDFANISSPFTLNGVSYGSTGAVFDNTSDYIDLPFFHAGMEIEIDVASISLGQNANRRFFSSYRNQGFLYRNSNVWSFYNGSWYDTNIADSGYFDNSTVKIVVDSNNYWHIYKDDVLIFEPAGACAISEPAIGSKDGSCIDNATITGVRMKEATS